MNKINKIYKIVRFAWIQFKKINISVMIYKAVKVNIWKILKKLEASLCRHLAATNFTFNV